MIQKSCPTCKYIHSSEIFWGKNDFLPLKQLMASLALPVGKKCITNKQDLIAGLFDSNGADFHDDITCICK